MLFCSFESNWAYYPIGVLSKQDRRYHGSRRGEEIIPVGGF